MLPKRPVKKRTVYLDHAAATPLDPRVFQAMRPFLTDEFANPSSLYGAGIVARKVIDTARKKVADCLATQPDSIIFTGGGTESCNLAVFGIRKRSSLLVGESEREVECRSIKRHVITTAVEHHAVLNSIRQLEKEGFDVTYLSVNKEGQINLQKFKKALRPETVLVSIMYANNEVGTIYPITEIGREILKWRKENKTAWPYFHTDACQAAPYLELNVERLHVDLMSLNGSKIYGPKGVGVLYKRRGVELEPIMYGGGQEYGLRPGTENVAGIVGFGTALEKVQREREKEAVRVASVRNYFWEQLQKKISDVLLNGTSISGPSPCRGGKGGVVVKSRALLATSNPPYVPPTRRENSLSLANNLSVRFTAVDAEALILYLDEYGIMCSSGSACTTDSDEVSHVLLACGLTETEAKNSIRFTLGRGTTKKEIDYVLKYLPKVVEQVRAMNTGVAPCFLEWLSQPVHVQKDLAES